MPNCNDFLLEQLEEKWKQANDIARKNVDDEKEVHHYAVSVLKNMLSLNSNWWEISKDTRKQNYLRNHPKSKYREIEEPVFNDVEIDNESDEIGDVEPFKPDSKEAIKSTLNKAVKISTKAIEAIMENKQDQQIIDDSLDGKELTTKERARALRINIKAIGKLLMVAAVLASLFSPLSNVAGAVGIRFLDSLANAGSGEEPEDYEPDVLDRSQKTSISSTNSTATRWIKAFTKWLSEQDLELLIAETKEG